MGFIDALKRWRLAQQGLSSGKKRRVHSQNAVLQAFEDSIWLKYALYSIFVVSCSVLALKSAPGTSFQDSPHVAAIFGLVFAVTGVVLFHATLHRIFCGNSRVLLVFGGLLIHLMFLRMVIIGVASGAISEPYLYLLIPYALAPMLHSVLLGRAMGSFSVVFVTLMGCLYVPFGEATTYMILSIVAGVTSVLISSDVRKRVQLLRAGIYVGALTVALGLLLGRLDIASVFGPNSMSNLQLVGLGSASAFGVAILTSLLISGFLPVFEGVFSITTDISWLELSDLNHKLLRRMQLEAPGTFHHSLVVAALSESAAETIGANAPMCRVCAYFHDVGKLKKPSYFIENQHDGAENPHDTLTPTMSSLIIVAHVKDGIDLAVKHKLNPRIIDIIQEHHGDSLVAYFYRRAQEQKKVELEKVDRKLENPEDLPKVDEKNFRYPGPRPSTRESAIIALADTIESASRSLQKPTPARIRSLINDLVRTKIRDGQLDECPLTLKELALVKESFANTLRSMLHSRISYPKDDEKKDRGDRDTYSARPDIKQDSDSSDAERVIEMPKRA